MTLSRLTRRLAHVRRYTAMARTPLEKIRLAVLGVARGHPFSSPGLLSATGRALWPSVVVRPAALKGLRAVIDTTELGQMIIFDEVILSNNYDLRDVPFAPDQIFDCGGHVGLFSLLASGTYPGVPLTVYEPNPRNADCIRRQKRINNLPFAVIEAAVSTEEGEAVFQDQASFSGCLVDAAPPSTVVGSGRQYRVKVVDFPAVVRACGASRLLLKIDVEGEEVRLLPALFDGLPRTCAIFFETHAGEPGWEQVARSLTRQGFAVERRRTMGDFIDGFALRRA